MPLALTVASAGTTGQPDLNASAGDLWRILWRRRGLIVLTTVAMFAAALTYGLTTPTLYTASAQLIIDPHDRPVMANSATPASLPPDGGVIEIESQVEVIQSSAVLMRAIAASDLTRDPEFNGEETTLARLTTWWRGTPPPPRPQADVELATLRMLKRRLAVTRSEKVFVVGVNITANSAEKSARLANAVVDAYLADQSDARTQSGQKVSTALMARLEGQRSRLEALDNEIQAYRRANNIVTANGNYVGEQRLIDFTANLTAAQSRAAALRARIDQLHEPNVSVTSIPEAMQSPVISGLRQQEGQLAEKQAELEAKVGPGSAQLNPVRAQLASIRQLITAELNRIAGAMQGDYVRAMMNVHFFEGEVERAKTENAAVRQAAVRLREMERQLEADRAVYASFLARARETGEAAGVDTPNVRVITLATPPLQKSWPPLSLLLAAAIGSGIGLGSGLALIREYVTPTILSREQIERNAGAPVVGIIPRSALANGRRRLGDGAPGSQASPSVQAIIGLALRRLFDVGADSALRERTGVRSLLITSGSDDAEVRQSVCRLIASVAAMRGDRVLLVDADIAGGSPGAVPGLLDVLRGEYTLEALVDVAPATGVASLGKGRDQRLLGNRSWSSVMLMLSEARKHFDILIVDGGEVAENLQAAPLLLAADEVLLVAQMARSTQGEVSRAADAAIVMGRPISAVLLVDVMEQT
jgi:uncharacterized protein involved in exopolysaccharide biosynthesis/Mrp family chromosome partitioning ATPase